MKDMGPQPLDRFIELANEEVANKGRAEALAPSA
jgi:hypothetical protein